MMMSLLLTYSNQGRKFNKIVEVKNYKLNNLEWIIRWCKSILFQEQKKNEIDIILRCAQCNLIAKRLIYN